MADIQFVKNQSELEKYIANNDVLLTYFTASWCGPCQAIKPVVESLYEKYKNVEIVKIDIDSNSESASKYGISSVPTFIGFQKSKEVSRLKGANVEALTKLIVQLSAMSTIERKGLDVSSRISSYNEISKYIPNGFDVLNNTIFFGEFEALNALTLVKSSSADVKNVFKLDIKSDSTIISDSDSQLLFRVPFLNISKIYSILIKTSTEKSRAKYEKSDLELDDDELETESQAPNLVKSWNNSPSIISFDNAVSDDNAPHKDIIEASKIDANGWYESKLRYVRFQNCNSIDLFFDGDDEDYHTIIEKIVIIGISGDSKEQGKIQAQHED